METGAESFLVGYPSIISYDCTKKLVEQMEKDICKIIVEKDRGTGLFCKIPFPNKETMLNVLITNNHIINDDLLYNTERNIKIKIEEEENEKVINLNNRLRYTSKKYDTTIIEIKEEDKINNFLELDDDIINNIINNKNENVKYKEKTVYIIHYPEGNLSVSYGIINDIFEDEPYNFLHKCSTRKGSSGSPIINLNNKIIGIHKKSYDKNYNGGIFLNYPIKDFITKNHKEILKDKNIFNKEFSIDLNDSITKNLFKDTMNIDKDFIEENPIIFKRFKLISKLAEGDFTNVYLGSNILTKESIAIKVESNISRYLFLESEAFYLFQIRGIGIPDVLSFGRKKYYNILVEPYLGKSLFEIFKENGKLNLGDICIIAKQLIDRIQWVHSKGFIHRDIKLDNCLTGRINENIIYLIDFYLSKKYRSSKTGKHIKYGYTRKFIGTTLFSSINALKGFETSRRDDLESIAYMIIYLMKGKLPWENEIEINEIYRIKRYIKMEDLCKNIPKGIMDFIRYVRNLEFEEKPDYDYLRALINDIVEKKNIYNDSLKLSFNNSTYYKYINNPINNYKKIKYTFHENFHQTVIKDLRKRNNSFITQNEFSNKATNKVRFFPINANRKLSNIRYRTKSDDSNYKFRKKKSKKETIIDKSKKITFFIHKKFK